MRKEAWREKGLEEKEKEKVKKKESKGEKNKP